MPTWEVVFERECGIEKLRAEGKRGRGVVWKEGRERGGVVEEAGSLTFAPMLLSRVCVWARPTLSAATALEELDLLPFSALQVKVWELIRFARRCRISETVAGGKQEK
jgi:hypothetical protein